MLNDRRYRLFTGKEDAIEQNDGAKLCYEHSGLRDRWS